MPGSINKWRRGCGMVPNSFLANLAAFEREITRAARLHLDAGPSRDKGAAIRRLLQGCSGPRMKRKLEDDGEGGKGDRGNAISIPARLLRKLLNCNTSVYEAKGGGVGGGGERKGSPTLPRRAVFSPSFSFRPLDQYEPQWRRAKNNPTLALETQPKSSSPDS